MKRSKSVAASMIASLAAITLAGCSSPSTATDDKPYKGQVACVDQFATDSSIDDMVEGFKEGLSEAIDGGLKVEVQNPNADTATEQTIAQKFVSQGCAVIAAVGTSGTQAHLDTGSNIPLLFIASSIPEQAGFVDSLEKPGGRVTGVMDAIRPEDNIDAMLQIDPSIETVGLIWRTGDASGDPFAERVVDYLDSLGIKHESATISSGADATQAAQTLSVKTDAIFLPGDTTTIAAAPGIVAAAADNNVPVFGGVVSVVEAGGIAAVGFDYKDVGLAAGELALQILDGADPAETPVVSAPNAGFAVNETQAAKLGLTIPAELKIMKSY